MSYCGECLMGRRDHGTKWNRGRDYMSCRCPRHDKNMLLLYLLWWLVLSFWQDQKSPKRQASRHVCKKVDKLCWGGKTHPKCGHHSVRWSSKLAAYNGGTCLWDAILITPIEIGHSAHCGWHRSWTGEFGFYKHGESELRPGNHSLNSSSSVLDCGLHVTFSACWTAIWTVS